MVCECCCNKTVRKKERKKNKLALTKREKMLIISGGKGEELKTECWRRSRRSSKQLVLPLEMVIISLSTRLGLRE